MQSGHTKFNEYTEQYIIDLQTYDFVWTYYMDDCIISNEYPVRTQLRQYFTNVTFKPLPTSYDTWSRHLDTSLSDISRSGTC